MLGYCVLMSPVESLVFKPPHQCVSNSAGRMRSGKWDSFTSQRVRTNKVKTVPELSNVKRLFITHTICLLFLLGKVPIVVCKFLVLCLIKHKCFNISIQNNEILGYYGISLELGISSQVTV